MLTLRPLQPADLSAIVGLSLRAWQPVFASFEAVLGPRVYSRLYPDWRANQADEVRETLAHADTTVALVDDVVAGFAAVVYHAERAVERVGEIDMIAVDPAFQRRGLATALIEAAVEHMIVGGCELAVIGTGGDDGHAPARAAYEKANFTALPLVRYYRALER